MANNQNIVEEVNATIEATSAEPEIVLPDQNIVEEVNATIEATPAESKIVLPDDYIVLADGTLLEGSAGYDDDRTIWVWFTKEKAKPMAELFAIFTTAEKTQKIQSYHKGKLLGEWEGFTKLYSFMSKDSGNVDIGLRKP